jgi:hypothetical protein
MGVKMGGGRGRRGTRIQVEATVRRKLQIRIQANSMPYTKRFENNRCKESCDTEFFLAGSIFY